MPKMKTNRAAAKRFNITANGKIKMNHTLRRHFLTHKTSKKKRQLGRKGYLAKCDEAQVRRMIPYK